MNKEHDSPNSVVEFTKVKAGPVEVADQAPNAESGSQIDHNQSLSALWLRPKEAEAHSKIASSTLAKMRLTGNGPPFTKLGSIVLYNRELLDEWLLARTRTSTSEPT